MLAVVLYGMQPKCHSATESGSGIEMQVPCGTNQVEAFTRKNEYGSLLLAGSFS